MTFDRLPDVDNANVGISVILISIARIFAEAATQAASAFSLSVFFERK